MLKYSPRALPAIVKIFQQFNDLNLFVEDTTAENIYRVFFQRLLPADVRITKIFQCEGRLGVISAASEKRYEGLNRKFFMIDGDLFLLCGEKYHVPSNVFRLEMYCIENSVVCLDAAEQFAYECEPKLTREEIRLSLKLDVWFEKVVKTLTPLFIWYAAAMFFSAQVKTSSRSGISFLKPGSSDLDRALVTKRISEIRLLLEAKHGKPAVQSALKSVKEAHRYASDPSIFISAKTYLLPLLARHLRMRSAFQDEQSLVYRLCHHCNIGRLGPLRNCLSESLR